MSATVLPGLAFVVRAQTPDRTYRIGVLGAVRLDTPVAARVWDAFRLELQRRGWFEGRNIAFDHRSADGDDERWPGLAQELIERRVDLIVVAAGTGALAVKAATRTIPVVFTIVPDPVGQGVVANLARPGGNLTGVGSMSLELAGKRLELLKETFPRIARVALLPYANESTDTVHRAANLDVARAARSLGLQLLPARVQRADDLERAVGALHDADAWYVQDDILYVQYTAAVLRLLAAQRKPAIFAQTFYVEAGGLMSYAVDLPDQFRRAAIYVDRILRGARPADLPVELPRRFELSYNLQTAKAFGLTIPALMLRRADKLFE